MVFMSTHTSRRSPLYKAMRFMLGVVAVAAIVWGLSCVPYDILREERFRLMGETQTSGVVLAMYTNNTASSPDTRFVIKYKFVDPDGYARTILAPLPQNIWELCTPGSQVNVFYPSSKPEFARIPGEVEPAFQAWLRSVLD